jgi:hypothetical protein
LPSHEDKVSISIPAALTASIRFPQKALSDGSPNPEWVGFLFRQGDSRTAGIDLGIPLTPCKARVARRLLAYRRLRRTVIAPIVILASLSFVAMIAFTSPRNGFLLILLIPAAGTFFGLVDRWVRRRLFTMQAPQQIQGGIRIEGVHAETAKEISDLNPGIELTSGKPAKG